MTLDELIQALNNSSADAREVLSKLRELLLVNGDVNFNLADGTVITAPSLPKLRQQYWDNIDSVMDRTYYVDAVNGNDSNPGTQDQPFQTLKKAVDSIPVGGYGKIVLVGGQTYTIDSHIFVKNKSLYFVGDSNNPPTISNTAFTDGSYNRTNKFRIKLFGVLIFDYINIALPSKVDPSLPLSVFCFASVDGHYNRGLGIFGFRGSINLGLDGASLVISNGSDVNVSVIDSDVTTNSAGYVLSIGSSTTARLDISGCTIDDTTHWVSGLVKDANGVPRNVISNLIL